MEENGCLKVLEGQIWCLRLDQGRKQTRTRDLQISSVDVPEKGGGAVLLFAVSDQQVHVPSL